MIDAPLIPRGKDPAPDYRVEDPEGFCPVGCYWDCEHRARTLRGFQIQPDYAEWKERAYTRGGILDARAGYRRVP